MKRNVKQANLEGQRVLIVSGPYAGAEGICLGKSAEEGRWAVSPDSTTEVVHLRFEEEFGLLVDLSCDPQSN